MTVKRDARGRLRDYAKEYERDHSSSKDIANRSARNSARRSAVQKHGKAKLVGKDVDHKKELSLGGSKSGSNTRIISRSLNRGRSNKKTH